MTRTVELEAKHARIRALLDRHRKAGLLLATPAGFSWLTCGGRGIGAVLLTRDARYLLTHGSSRVLIDEELLDQRCFTLQELPWWHAGGVEPRALEIVPAGELLADVALPDVALLPPAEALTLRAPLLAPELERYRELGETLGITLTHALLHCRPGWTEHQLAGLVAGTLTDFGVEVVRVSAAVDDHASGSAEAFATNRRLERYGFISVTARQHGLHVSATRSVHFDPPPAELLLRHRACAGIDASLIAATRPGTPLRELFEAAREAYRTAGAAEAWQRFPFGGATGYAYLDERAGPEAMGRVTAPQAFAWSPTLAGVRSGDTILVTESNYEVLTRTPDLPTLTIETAAGPIERPAILVR